MLSRRLPHLANSLAPMAMVDQLLGVRSVQSFALRSAGRA